MDRHSVAGALLLGVGVIAGWVAHGATVAGHAVADAALPSSPGHSQEGMTPMSQPGRILGIGGIFFKSANPQQMQAWYGTHLGLTDGGHGVVLPWREHDHPEREQMTIWSIFPGNTTYFDPSPASFMVNYIVDDLDALLDRLAKEGVRIDPKRQDESYGRFAWIYDPDGNKIELWQPLNK
jgi:catechol 2,3-dioxygenase-like lactoylglutathione lyase family enzyme